MASLFKSISNALRGKRDQVAKAMADPVRDGKYNIEDSEKKAAEFRKVIAQGLAQNKAVERELTEAKEAVKKYDKYAKMAAEKEDEASVREALQKKNEAKRKVDSLSAEITKNTAMLDNQRKQLASIEDKITRAKSNHRMLSVRMEGAKTRKALAEAQSKFTSGEENPIARLDDLEKAVNEAESEAEAYEDLSGVNDESLEDKYGAPGAEDLDDEVAKLMAKAKK